MIGFTKYLVKTELEITAMSALLDWNNLALPSQGGKTLKDLHGQNKTHNKDFFYTLKELGGALINNPDHSDFGKYFLAVHPDDVAMHLAGEVDNLVDLDETWRI